MKDCPCGTHKSYDACCGRFIAGTQLPSTPEELMRSRYTAYTQANVDYIAGTMKSPALDHFNPHSAREWAERVEWLKLDVITTSAQENKGYVEFLAHFYDNKKKYAIHELSEFHRIDGVWFYVDGKSPTERPPVRATLLGRNAPCHCGSGKKHKRCCGDIN